MDSSCMTTINHTDRTKSSLDWPTGLSCATRDQTFPRQPSKCIGLFWRGATFYIYRSLFIGWMTTTAWTQAWRSLCYSCCMTPIRRPEITIPFGWKSLKPESFAVNTPSRRPYGDLPKNNLTCGLLIFFVEPTRSSGHATGPCPSRMRKGCIPRIRKLLPSHLVLHHTIAQDS
jgi:hypothetical protein